MWEKMNEKNVKKKGLEPLKAYVPFKQSMTPIAQVTPLTYTGPSRRSPSPVRTPPIRMSPVQSYLQVGGKFAQLDFKPVA